MKLRALRDPDGGWTGYDGRPAAVKNSGADSFQRLGVEHLDVYRIARLDPAVPIEETVGAIAELVEKGYVRHIGLSEMGAQTIRGTTATAPIADLQIERADLRPLQRRPETRAAASVVLRTSLAAGCSGKSGSIAGYTASTTSRSSARIMVGTSPVVGYGSHSV
ncbi:aldo/keto reductase family protein [Streptomyces sp. BK205]|nr:aldo/keto reductase family protein [Streptomyces sp. BK205]